METYIAKKGERLDNIAYNYYKTLDKEVFNKVLEVNPHLLKKCVLESFDKVYLPTIEKEQTITKGKALW